MKRRRLPPDTRPDWRDPNMPVLRKIEYTNGFQRVIRLEELTPEQESFYAKKNMDAGFNPFTPHWTQDTTYHLTNRRRRR